MTVQNQISYKSALVTGATGYIGRYLVEALLAQGVEVGIVSRSAENVLDAWKGRVAVVEADITAIFEFSGDYDVFFHCAGAIRTEEEFQAVNVDGTRNVLEACKKNGSIKRFIDLSSVGVMGCSKPGSFDESYPCNPGNAYEISKYDAELIAKEFASDFTITSLRPSIVFGPGRAPELDSFLALVNSIKSAKFRRLGGNSSFYNLIFVEDVVEALLAIAVSDREKVDGEFFNINDPISWPDFCSLVDKIVGGDEVKTLSPLVAFPIAVVGSFLTKLGIRFPLTLGRYHALTSKTVFESQKIVNPTFPDFCAFLIKNDFFLTNLFAV